MPALSTARSRGPWAASMRVTAAATAAASVTSRGSGVRAWDCCASSAKAPAPRAEMATRAPRPASSRARARPMPWLAPVIHTDPGTVLTGSPQAPQVAHR